MGVAMRDIYYRVTAVADVPRSGALVRIWCDSGLLMADVTTWGVDCTEFPTDPDMALVRASLARARYDLLGIFVLIEDEALWHPEWGELRQ